LSDKPGAKSSFAALANDRTRVLILGSLPGEVSLSRGQYYANPRNQFWVLMQAVIGFTLPQTYEDRMASLSSGGVGLWGVIESANRVGSLDADIRKPQGQSAG